VNSLISDPEIAEEKTFNWEGEFGVKSESGY
jgi:hypothetical protein